MGKNTKLEKSFISENKKNLSFLKKAIRRRLKFSFGMDVTESDIMFAIGYEYWRDGKGEFELPTDIRYSLIETISEVFKEGNVKRISTVQNGKSMYPFFALITNHLLSLHNFLQNFKTVIVCFY